MLEQLDVRVANGSAAVRDGGSRGSTVPARGAFSSDAALASRVRHGDRRALRSLYGRYAGDVFDFAVRVTGADDAPDVVEETFTSAWDRLRVGIKPTRVEPWLLGIARSSALGRTRSTHVSLPDGAVGERAELARRWADALSPREYAFVDLYARRGLSVRELAAITGVSEQAVRDRLERLGAGLERFAACELVLRQRTSCLSLLTLLDRVRGATPDDVRRAVQLHARLCDVCGVVVRRAGSTLGTLAELPAVRWPADASASTWAVVAAYAAGQTDSARSSGTASPRPSRSVVLAAALGACAVAAALAVGLLDPFGGGNSREKQAADSDQPTSKLAPPLSIFKPPVAAKSQSSAPKATVKKQERAEQGPQAAAKEPAPDPGSDGGSTGAAAKPAPQSPAAQPPKAAAKQETKPAAPTQQATETPKPKSPAAQSSPKARTLAWAPVNGAIAYELVLQRDGVEVYKARTEEARTLLPGSWEYKGHPTKLQTGYYRWLVWPIMSDQRRAEKANVVSNLHID